MAAALRTASSSSGSFVARRPITTPLVGISSTVSLPSASRAATVRWSASNATCSEASSRSRDESQRATSRCASRISNPESARAASM